jgi:hypothetical protein
MLGVAGVIHVDGTVCRTGSSRRSESRGASACSVAIASAAIDWRVRPVPGAVGRERLEPEAAGVLSPFEQRAVLTAAPAGTWIVVPDVVGGAFIKGTEFFPNAARASGQAVTNAYRWLDSLISCTEEATSGLLRPDEDADPAATADEITCILALPFRPRPFRCVVDYIHSGVEIVSERHGVAFLEQWDSASCSTRSAGRSAEWRVNGLCGSGRVRHRAPW